MTDGLWFLGPDAPPLEPLSPLDHPVAALLARLDAVEAFIAAQRKHPFMLADLIKRLAFETGIPLGVLLGQSRQARVVRIRHAYYWIACRKLGRSLSAVGRAIGDRDHKTVFSGLKRADALRELDPSFLRLTDLIAAEYDVEQLA